MRIRRTDWAVVRRPHMSSLGNHWTLSSTMRVYHAQWNRGSPHGGYKLFLLYGKQKGYGGIL